VTEFPYRSGVAIVALILGTTVLAACGVPGSADAITLYNGQHPQTTQAIVSAFEKASGITVNVRSDDEGTLANQIAAEGAHSPADVVYTENSLVLQHLQEQGLLAPVAAGTLAGTESAYDSPQGDWVGVSARVNVMIYNPRLISQSQLPTAVVQLADARYHGKLALAAGETDFQPIVTSVADAYGQSAALSWLKGIKANAGSSHSYPDNETLSDQVNRGAVAFGMVNQYYWYRLRAEIGPANLHSRIATFAPRDPGYVIDVSGAAVLKSSRHNAAAQKFLAFLVSRQGQEIIAHSISFEYPLDAGVVTAANETPFDQLQPNPITIAQLGDGSAAVTLLRQAGLL
jgi:iron(III) transport system substrate-binding protein